MEASLHILIICTNQNRQPAPVMPYGACIVAEAAVAAGYRVSLLDLMFQSDPSAAVKAALGRPHKGVVGLSIRNLDNNDMQSPVEFINEVAEIARLVRRHTPVPLVLGGPAVGIMPEALLRLTGATCAVLGEGEAVFPLLLKALEEGKEFGQAHGVAWLEGNRYRMSLPSRIQLLPSALTPKFSKWLNLKAYRNGMAAAPLQSKRGCPFSCIYCTYGISEGRDYRLVPPEEVAAAVSRLAAMGCRDIEMVDNVFNSPYEHALEICAALARSRSPVRLQTLELNPAFIDDELLASMDRAGFVGVGVTADSAADPVLARLKKGFGVARLELAAESIKRSSLPCLWIFLVGGPGETEATLAETFSFARRCLRPGDAAFFNLGVRIYPGTELEVLARQEGVLSAATEEMIEPVFYFSPELDFGRTLNQVRRTVAENLNMIHSSSFDHPWLPVVNRLFSRLPLKPPLWRHTRSIRRVVRALGRDI
jgi:radical SAM superfamily enzyme YgiQ (UPF0313 family)